MKMQNRLLAAACAILLILGTGETARRYFTETERESCDEPAAAGSGGEEMAPSEDTGALFPESPLIFSENPAEENLADLLQTAAAGMMVKVLAGELEGSGVIYQAEGERLTIVTAAHVLERAEEGVEIEFCDGFRVKSSLWQTSSEADLGFILTDFREIPKKHAEQYFTVNTDRKSFDELSPGDGVIVMGSEDGVAGNAYEGTLAETWIYLEDFSQYMMLVRGNAVQGMSGGGVFDQRGRFIGILCGGNADGELAVLPLSIIEAEYAEQI